MARQKRIPGGIGAKGEVLKRFLHPKADRNRIWPADNNKIRVSGVEVVNKSEKRVGGSKVQKVYDVKVPEHPDIVFYVVCKHFSVKVAPGTPFEDELSAASAGISSYLCLMKSSYSNIMF